ncbi:30S ribosomal protein S4 [bacterium]|nr:30S ribosomal protein S4 [bacterium]
MARYTGSVCKICRREGEKLLLKGSRCLTAKCAIEKKAYPPGQHGKTRRQKLSEYGMQLREKQKIRRYYGLLESQFRETFEKASRRKGITSEILLKMLESRLDNVVYRMGFAPSRVTARQLVRHRHFLVNDKIIDVPSYQMKPGDVIQVKEKSRKMALIHDAMQKIKEGRQMPWLQLDKAGMRGTFLEVPNRADMPVTFNEHLVVELYSK